jgi:NADPH-ferrihemoprotein reductase
LKYSDTPATDRQKVPFDNPRRSFYDSKTPLRSKVLVNKELLKTTDNRSTVHVEFDIKGSNMSYEAGDHLAVFPENDQEIVEAYAKRLGVEKELETVFSLVSKDSKQS